MAKFGCNVIVILVHCYFSYARRTHLHAAC